MAETIVEETSRFRVSGPHALYAFTCIHSNCIQIFVRTHTHTYTHMHKQIQTHTWTPAFKEGICYEGGAGSRNFEHVRKCIRDPVKVSVGNIDVCVCVYDISIDLYIYARSCVCGK